MRCPPDEHRDAFAGLLAHAPRRIGQQRLEQRDRRRVLAARDHIGELDAHQLVTVAQAGADHGLGWDRTSVRTRAAASTPRASAPTGRVRALKARASAAPTFAASSASRPPGERRRGPPRARSGRGPARRGPAAARRAPRRPAICPACARQAASARGHPYGARLVLEGRANVLDSNGVLGSQEAVSVDSESAKRNFSSPGRVL